MDYCWQTDDIWGGLINESFNGVVTGITGDENLFLSELLSFLLKHRLSQGVLCEELYECLLTEDSWGGLMTELFNGGGTDINGDENLLLFDLLPLRLKHRLSLGFVRCLPLFSLFCFCGDYQYLLDLAWWMQCEFVVVLCAFCFVCWCPLKCESQIFGATTAVMFDFQYQE